jgi:hypothetical protein
LAHLDVTHPHSAVNIRSGGSRVLEQHEVEASTVDVPRVGTIHTLLIALREAHVGVCLGLQALEVVPVDSTSRRGPCGAILAREARALHLLDKSDLVEDASR